jgi:hypothetical protein
MGDLVADVKVEVSLGFTSLMGEAVTEALLTTYLLELSHFWADLRTLSLVLF